MIKLIVFIVLTAHCNGKEMNKIIGGALADFREFPDQISLEYRGYHICGGSIVTNYHVITSASCVVFELVKIAGNLRILAGTNDRRNQLRRGTYHNVEYVIYHPDYSPQLFWKHDIAVLKLETPINLDRRLRKKIRISQNPLNTRKLVKTCGWGYNSESLKRLTRYLKTTRMKIQNPRICSKHYGGHQRLHASQKCASTVDPNTFISRGNGGAGVTLLNQLSGIISVSFINHARTIIFTKIYPMYHEWIRHVVEFY